MGGAITFEAATRIGFAARGIMYLLIGWLALRSGRTEDGTGIIDYLDSGGGRLLLAGMAVGFLAYGAWRATDAWTDSSGRGSDAKGLALRAGGLVSGLVHLGLGLIAATQASAAGPGGGGDSARQGAAAALDLPGGGLILVLAAAGLLLTGLFQLRQAWTLAFMDRLGGRGGSADWVCWLGRAGYAARGIVFIVMAWFFGRAGSEESSAEAGGLGAALGSLPGTLQMAVAGGLSLFGLFSLVEARYRRIDTPRLANALRPGNF